MDAVFLFPVQNFLQNVLEKLTKVFGALPSLSGVFCQIFEHGPEVDKRTPVDVAEVGEKHVFFKIV